MSQTRIEELNPSSAAVRWAFLPNKSRALCGVRKGCHFSLGIFVFDLELTRGLAQTGPLLALERGKAFEAM